MWALAAAAAAAEQDGFTDEDSESGSEEEGESYDNVSKRFSCVSSNVPQVYSISVRPSCPDSLSFHAESLAKRKLHHTRQDKYSHIFMYLCTI